ncbi:MAG: hypothetical protein ACRDNH_02760 [Gaiellaceae bacterium]
MTRRPDFDELLEGVDDPRERERLRRVHELLLETDPPPELSPTLVTPPPASPRDLPWQRPRRVRPRAVLVVAVVVTAFLVGYLAGNADSPRQGSTSGMTIVRTVELDGENGASGAIGVGAADETGNWPMVLTTWGLDHVSDGDYYTLKLMKDGEARVTCGTFNVSGRQTTVRMVAAYDLKRFDGWVVMLWDAQTREDRPVLRSNGI